MTSCVAALNANTLRLNFIFLTLKAMGYGGTWVEAWVRAFVDTWNGRSPTTQTHAQGVWWGLGWGLGFRGMILVWPLRACHVIYYPAPCPASNPRHWGHAPTQAPGVVVWAFSANPRPNPRPIPHGLS
ncbi:hypothetical protein HanPI659440_Chr03g0133421 [Helianthus annuus]|nr:hypothetical protein HanPI659440_Chr03g0133421 [Helianthus annuus]